MELSFKASDVARMDAEAIERGRSPEELMDRAGWAVAAEVQRLLGGLYGRRILILCGKGNNGGDGFVAARLLRRKGAYPVVVLPFDEEPSFRGAARQNFERLGDIPVKLGVQSIEHALGRADCVIDAMLGTGAKGSPRGLMKKAIEEVKASNLPVVAVDIPTGVDADTGAVGGRAIEATSTVTMGALKNGLMLPPGCDHAGRVVVADIGTKVGDIEPSFGIVGSSDLREVLRPLPKSSHKKSVGSVLVVGGSVGMSGAVALAARGALRAGAGMVTMATPASVAPIVDQQVPEALTLALPETPRGTLEASAVAPIVEASSANDVLALGPGMSNDPETAAVTHKLMEALDVPVVLDADALNHFAGKVSSLSRYPDHLVLTPHPGEMGRLLGGSTNDVQADRLQAVKRAAKEAEAQVLLKGYRSLVASPTGEAVLIPSGGPALATGGSGDVLSGVTAAFLASGLPPFTSTWAAAYVHGIAGDRLAKKMGDRGVVASDLGEAIASTLAQVRA